jgi:hypothetical protein
VNREQYKAKKRELAEKLSDLNELARLEKLGISAEQRRLLEKERQHIRKQERAKIKEEEDR